MKTVIEMAIEAELIYNEEGWCGWVEDTDLRPFIEHFAELVRADAIADEREACAKFIEDEYVRQFVNPWREDLAAAIRARSNT